MSAFASRLRGLWENARPSDWWEFKIPPLLATAYATALLLRVPFEQLWPLLLMLLFALLPGAAYVSVLNDITDLEDDLKVGKSNRMVGRSPAFKIVALAFCLGLGVVAGWFFRHDPLTLALYSVNWVAYTLYSARPFRFKTRGIWGVAADASGAHLLPTLWTSSFIAEATSHPVPAYFLSALGVWSMALGVRGILWHQLYDRENDRLGRVSTFGAQASPEAIRRFVAGVAFPLEVVALALILLQAGTARAWIVLILYLAMEFLNRRYMDIDIIIVQPTARFRIIFAEYYQLWFPLTFLIGLTEQSLAVSILIALQLALFPHCFYVFIRHVWFIVRQKMLRSLRGKIRLLIGRRVT